MGQFVKGLKTGQGKFSWADGSYYEGEFQNGNIQGIGVYWWNDGRKYVGGWQANKMHGKGYLDYGDGRIYEGNFMMIKNMEMEYLFLKTEGDMKEAGVKANIPFPCFLSS